MGNSAASRFTGVPFESGNGTTAASICGENTHQLSTLEAPKNLWTFNDPKHSHTVTYGAVDGLAVSPGGSGPAATKAVITTSSVSTGITLTDNAGDGKHNTVQRSITGTWYRKL
jgi:hypothetical protein